MGLARRRRGLWTKRSASSSRSGSSTVTGADGRIDRGVSRDPWPSRCRSARRGDDVVVVSTGRDRRRARGAWASASARPTCPRFRRPPPSARCVSSTPTATLFAAHGRQGRPGAGHASRHQAPAAVPERVPDARAPARAGRGARRERERHDRRRGDPVRRQRQPRGTGGHDGRRRIWSCCSPTSRVCTTADPRWMRAPSCVERRGDRPTTSSRRRAAPARHVGSGGMSTKLEAASMLMKAGIPMVVCEGRRPGGDRGCRAGEPVGTLFAGGDGGGQGRKLWLAYAGHPKGSVTLTMARGSPYAWAARACSRPGCPRRDRELCRSATRSRGGPGRERRCAWTGGHVGRGPAEGQTG